MKQSTNLFLDNINLKSQNSLSHLFDFNDDYTDLTHCIQPSKYYNEGDILSKLNTNFCAIMSLNCQSLHAKFSQIKLLVNTFAENNTSIQVLCLHSELIDLGLYQIENYHLVTKNRYASAHGGVACYIHRNWNYKVNPHTVDSLYWEELFIEITDPSNPKYKLTVENFYRPPHTSITQLTSFFYYFTQKLSMLTTRENTFA